MSATTLPAEAPCLPDCPMCGLPFAIEHQEPECVRLGHWCNETVTDTYIVHEAETLAQCIAALSRRAVPSPVAEGGARVAALRDAEATIRRRAQNARSNARFPKMDGSQQRWDLVASELEKTADALATLAAHSDEVPA